VVHLLSKGRVLSGKITIKKKKPIKKSNKQRNETKFRAVLGYFAAPFPCCRFSLFCAAGLCVALPLLRASERKDEILPTASPPNSWLPQRFAHPWR
jgi:hypothetical protein